MKKLFNVRNVLATTLLAGSFLGASSAYASDGTIVDAGTTPDSPMYTFDQLFENLQLAFTFDSKKEANLLLQFAQERLDEAKVMSDKQKKEYVKEAINRYMDTLKKAEDKSSEVLLDDNVQADEKTGLSQNIEKVTQVDDSIKGDLSDETKTKLEEKTDEAKIVANVVKGIDPAVVQALKDKGLGYGQISKVVALSQITGKSIDELAAAVADGQGFGKIAKDNGLHPSEIAMKVKENRLNALLDEAKQSGNEKKVALAEKKVAKFQEQKAKLTTKLENKQTKLKNKDDKKPEVENQTPQNETQPIENSTDPNQETTATTTDVKTEIKSDDHLQSTGNDHKIKVDTKTEEKQNSQSQKKVNGLGKAQQKANEHATKGLEKGQQHQAKKENAHH